MTEFSATPPFPPGIEHEIGPEDAVYGNSMYWRSTDGDDGSCAVSGKPPWPITNRLDRCGGYVRLMRL